jgi:hypothetical protein
LITKPLLRSGCCWSRTSSQTPRGVLPNFLGSCQSSQVGTWDQ